MCKSEKGTRIGVVIELPLSPNFKKQLKLLWRFFPEYNIDVISPLGVSEIEEANFDQLENSSSLMYFYLFLNVCSYLKRCRPNFLINFSGPMIVVPLITGLGRLFDVPVAARLPGNTFGEYKLFNGFRRVFIYFFRNLMGEFSLKLVSRLVVMGPLEKKRLIRRGLVGEKISIIPPFIEKELISEGGSKSTLGFPVGCKIVLFVGRVTRLKGADRLEKIAKEVGKQREDIVFCVVGDGEYRERLEKLENVRYVGIVDSKEMNKYYEAADLLVHPSRAEGLPNVVLEALSFGVPVVASNVGEMPWVVSNTFNDWRDFVEYIVEGKWRSNKLPNVFADEEYRRRFEMMFEDVQ